MLLVSSLPTILLLLACLYASALAAPSSLPSTQHEISTQQATIAAESPQLPFAHPIEDSDPDNYHPNTLNKPQRRNPGPPGHINYETEDPDTERDIALCEAGIVGACHSAIQAGKSESESKSKSSPLTDPIDAESSAFLPSTGFIAATFFAVCVLVIIRRSVKGRKEDLHVQVKREGKN